MSRDSASAQGTGPEPRPAGTAGGRGGIEIANGLADGWPLQGGAMAPKKARKPTRTRDQGDSTARVICGSYDHEDPVIQMKAIKEALDAYFSGE